MMQIDVRTVFIIVALVQFLIPLCVLLSLVGRYNSEVYWWCGLGVLLGIGSFLIGLRGYIPDYLSIYLAQFLMIVGLAGHNSILYRWLNKFNRRHIVGYLILIITFIIALSIYLIWKLSDHIRILAAVLVVIILFLCRFMLGLNLKKQGYLAAGRMIQINASLIILSLSLILSDFNYSTVEIALFKYSTAVLISLVLVMIAMFLLNFAYMQMILKQAAGEMLFANEKMDKTLGKQQVLEDQMIRREQQFSQLSSNAGIHGFAAFSGAIAHELTQPLAAMLLNIDRMIRYLTKMNSEPRLLADLKNIKLDNTRAINIIQSLRLLLQNDDAVLLTDPVDIDDLTRDAVYVSKKQILSKRVTFTQHYNLRHVQIPGDHGLLLQVIINLITNAIKATNNVKEPQINLATMGNSDYVFFVLSDNGSGINQADSGSVFMPFKSISEQGRGVGLGLGLSIIKSIVKKHHGDVGFFRNAIAGVTFVVGLPRTVDTPAYVFDETIVRELIDNQLIKDY